MIEQTIGNETINIEGDCLHLTTGNASHYLSLKHLQNFVTRDNMLILDFGTRELHYALEPDLRKAIESHLHNYLKGENNELSENDGN